MESDSLQSVLAVIQDWWGYNAARSLSVSFWGAIGGAGVVSLYQGWRERRRQHRDLKKYKYSGQLAALQTTFYEFSGEISANTQQELVNQSIHTINDGVDLRDVFKAYTRQILKYIDKAAKKCTDEQPFVFVALKEVVPEKEWDATFDSIKTQWQNYMSTLFNPVSAGMPLDDERAVHARRRMLQLLTVQEAPNGKRHARILNIAGADIDRPVDEVLPARENLRISTPKGAVYDQGHVQMARYDSMRVILAGLRGDQSWIDGETAIWVSGGQTRKVPMPVLNYDS